MVQEVWQEFSSFAYQVVRLYTNTEHVEVEYTIGPIPFQYVATPPVVIDYYCVAIETIKVKKSLVAMTLPWQPTRCGILMPMAVR